MTAITQCKKCGNIYKFAIISDDIPPCPKCQLEELSPIDPRD